MTLNDLPQYHFDRDAFCKVVDEVFTWDEFVDVSVECGMNRHVGDFTLLRWEDEFYILHRSSGIMINWYKHAGRTNTCNEPGFTLDDLREFLVKLREDMVWDGLIKDEALKKELQRRWYKEGF